MMDEIDPQSAELKPFMSGILGLHGHPHLRQLGDYYIVRKIGQGGMGIVYEARQESLGRRVALKVLPTNISSREKFRVRFQREARAAARLHHTNIVPIFGVGEDRGILYYAMQYIQGQGLDAVLDDVKQMRGQPTELHPAYQSTQTFVGREAAIGLLTGQFRSAECHTPHSKPLPNDSQSAMCTPSPHALPQVGGERGVRGLQSAIPESAPLTEEHNLPQPVIAPADSGFDTRSDLSNQPERRYYVSIARLGVQAARSAGLCTCPGHPAPGCQTLELPPRCSRYFVDN